MARKNIYAKPFATPDSKYYWEAFCREVIRGAGKVGEERRRVALASFALFHEYINALEKAEEQGQIL